MRKFPYPMQRVHDARMAILNQCENRLAQAERERLTSLDHKKHCIEQIRDQAESVTTAGKHNVATLIHERLWFGHLVTQLDHAMQNCSRKEEHVNTKRNEVHKALQNCKIIENLTHRQKTIWTMHESKREQQEQDENSIIAFARKTQGFNTSNSTKPETLNKDLS